MTEITVEYAGGAGWTAKRIRAEVQFNGDIVSDVSSGGIFGHSSSDKRHLLKMETELAVRVRLVLPRFV
jgi:hypothetical protein